MRDRHKIGSVVLDRRIKLWNYFYWDAGKRRSKRIGTLREFPSKASAWKAAMELRQSLNSKPENTAPTVRKLVKQYRAEKMPQRLDTSRGYDSWIRVHILPKWAECSITELQARPVEMWLEALPLAPKSKVHVRGILSALWNFAMWKQDVPMQVNPISLVTIKGASKRIRQPRSLTTEQFRLLVSHLKEPFGTMARLCICLGLRISECLALKWCDVDWLNGTLRVERGIVEQNVDDVKTGESRRTLTIASELLDVLKIWKQATQFPSGEDWIFASPLKLGRLPYSYTGVWRELQRAADAAGIGHLGTHTFRHTYRTWLDSVGTPIGVQQKMMRHSDIRTTMNIYGDAESADMHEAHGKIVQLALQA